MQQLQSFDSIAHALALFESQKISGLPVVDPINRYVGVLTQSDIVRPRLLHALQDDPEATKLFVKDFMNRSTVVVVNEQDTMEKAVQLLYQREIRRLFVLNAKKQVVGVLSVKDVLRYLCANKVLSVGKS